MFTKATIKTHGFIGWVNTETGVVLGKLSAVNSQYLVMVPGRESVKAECYAEARKLGAAAVRELKAA